MRLLTLSAVALAVLANAACPPEEGPECGDGVIEAGEACDDGDTSGGDGCDAKCAVELGWWCPGEPSACVENLQSRGLSACVNGTFDGREDYDPDTRCYTFRAISGVSMGGGSSSRVAAAYPELFDVVGVMGTPFSDIDFFAHMIKDVHMGGFCPRDQILDNMDDLDNPETGEAFCGPVQLDDYAAPDSECRIFPSDFNHWFRGPDPGRGGGFKRDGLIEIFHDISFAYGNVFFYNPDSPLLPPGVPEAWRVPLGLTGAERDQARAERCANPVVVEGLYNAEYNPDGSFPAITFCDGERGDTGDYWPDHHTPVSGPAGAPDGFFQSPALRPGDQHTVSFPQHGYYAFHCAEHPGTEATTLVQVRGEACDDGNNTDGDGCSSTCLIEPGYTCSGTTCTSSCGNSALDPSEQCDDGNTTGGDGCDASCTIEAGFACDGAPSTCAATCGDGALAPGERCDDGGVVAGDGCSPGCRVEVGFRCDGAGPCVRLCGDGVLDAGEGCDDGGTADGDGCDASCAVEPGYTCSEQPSVCEVRCGDGIVDPGEGCDDGGTAGGDGCSALCAVEAGFVCTGQPSGCTGSQCGNGAINPGERCDDGDLEAGDGCSPWCQVEDEFKCSGNPSVCVPTCGDGALDPEDTSDFCAGGNGACAVWLAHLQGFGVPLTLRPQQPLRFNIVNTHYIPMEFALAVDYNGNGLRDYAEPLIINAEERYEDTGVDGCASIDEDGAGGCGGGAHDPISNPDPNGDDYDYMDNPLGTEDNYRFDEGEPYEDHGLDGVAATGDYGEGDGLYSQNPNLSYALEQSPRRRLAELPDHVFDRLDWWMDAGLRDFINSAQITNQLFGILRQREPDSRAFDMESSVPGYDPNVNFWFLDIDYSPAAIGKNAYLRYGDLSFCPGVDEVWGSGNHVGPGDQVLERLYTLLTFGSYRMPEGDFTFIEGDFDQLGGPTGGLGDFARLEYMHSEVLGREINYGLVLPPDYYTNTEARYPVTYFMHGQGMSASDLVLSGVIFLINQKESFVPGRQISDWQKMIIVFLDGECRDEDCYTGNFYVNFRGLPEGRQFEDGVIEVMQHIDATYRTKAPKVLPKQ